jgi:Transposase DDE domain
LLLQPNESGDNSRERIFTPKLTFFAFLDQVLDPESSCRSALDQILAYYQSLAQYPHIAKDTSAYCQARARWTCDELVAIRRALARGPDIHGDTLLPGIPGQRSLKVIDGTCFNLPDTGANRELCPQSDDQEPGCGFPLVRLVGVFSLKTGALLEETSAPYGISENELFHDLWPTFVPGDILVADRNFCSYASRAGLQLLRQTDGLFHLHASRNSDFRKGVRLGPRDRLVTWNKPTQKPANLSVQEWEQLPATLTVRMVRVRLRTSNSRCRTITLVTTLTDPKLWPVKLLAALYHRRWKIELYWDDIKTVLQMDMLSCKTPAMVHKEIQMHLIAYNLIRALMCEAALTAHLGLGSQDLGRAALERVWNNPAGRPRPAAVDLVCTEKRTRNEPIFNYLPDHNGHASPIHHPRRPTISDMSAGRRNCSNLEANANLSTLKGPIIRMTTSGDIRTVFGAGLDKTNPIILIGLDCDDSRKEVHLCFAIEQAMT